MHANTTHLSANDSIAAHAGRNGLRRSAANSTPRKSWEHPGAPDHRTRLRAHSTASCAHARALGARSTTTSAVGVFSTARRSLYHDASEMRRAVAGAMSPRSIATRPNPPACNSRSVALSACSALPPQRIHSSRVNATPAAAADVGSNASLASTRAQNSSRAVASEIKENKRLVRPDEAGPKISVTHPRGTPPKTASKLVAPDGRRSGARRSCSLKLIV
jgi:hypothetical protein